MSTVICLMLCFVPGQQGNGGVSIKNARYLVDNELVDSRAMPREVFDKRTNSFQKTSIQRTLVLSLQPDQRWSSGTAWVIRREQDGGNKCEAWRGTYTISINNKHDGLILELGMTRKYVGTLRGTAEVDWELDARYEPKGVELELPLEDLTVPQRVTASVTGAFFVDSSGKETLKRSSPDTLFEKITGEGAVRTLRTADYFRTGETLKLTAASIAHEPFAKEPPPGFKPHR